MKDKDYFELVSNECCSTCGATDHLTDECPEDVIFNQM